MTAYIWSISIQRILEDVYNCLFGLILVFNQKGELDPKQSEEENGWFMKKK